MKTGTIPWNQKIGDIGESEIEARLRRVSAATKISRDVGIDFFCELLIDEKPLLPFYVQAKSAAHWDSNQGRSIDKGTIVFWLSKPYPVYVLFYDDKCDICYWYPVEAHRYELIGKLFSTESESIYISFSRNNIFDKGENIEFKDQLHNDYQSLMAFQGNPQFGGTSYVKSVPPPPRSDLEYERAKLNARASLYSLIQLHLINKEADTARDFAEAVAKFDKSHHTHFVWLGYLYKEKGIKNLAIDNFRKAIDICQKDDKLEQDLKNTWITAYETEIGKIDDT